MKNKNSQLTKQSKLKIALYFLTRSIVFIILVYSIILMIIERNDEFESRYAFIALHSAIYLVVSFIPVFIEKNFKLEIPEIMEILFIVFCVGSILIGEIGGAYAANSWWDGLMHMMSGSLITIVSFSLINLINKEQNLHLELRPLFVVLFAFCFATTIGVVWEIIEYATDKFFNTNMQRFRDSITNVDFIGRSALKDTMQDFILNALGSLVVCIIGFIDLLSKKKLILIIEPLSVTDKTSQDIK